MANLSIDNEKNVPKKIIKSNKWICYRYIYKIFKTGEPIDAFKVNIDVSELEFGKNM